MSNRLTTSILLAAPVLLAAGALSAQELPYNRSIRSLEIVEEHGLPALKILYGLRVSDASRDRLVLDADLVVEVNGALVDLISTSATKAGGAITCAVTCSGDCPSIFGDGVCTGCGCDYSNTFTTPFRGDELEPGDVISVRLVPPRGAAPELDTADDAQRLQYSPPAPVFRRGDVNASGTVDIADAVSLLGCLFQGGACPTCPDAADANDDGANDLSDSIHILAWLFLGGPAPHDPGPEECGPDPTADRLSACVYRGPGCISTSAEDPTVADLESRLHYAAVALPERFIEPDDDAEPIRGTGNYGPREVVYDPRPGSVHSWNSAAGRRLLLEVGEMEADVEGARSHSAGSIEMQIIQAAEVGHVCVEPDHFVTASDRVFNGWTSQTFQAPGNAFASKAEATSFLAKVHAEQPFFLPFTHPDVRLGHGWYYSNGGGLHRACDYSRTGVEEDRDPTFLVKSAGSGEVVAVTWDHNAGNVVAVEHTAPGGQKVMFLYLHLRNGRSNDVALALSSTSTADKYVKYRAFATDFPNHLSWGTEQHKIQVKVGDHVKAGDIIGYAGNTGAGGAGSGLNADGSPKNWRGNVHLHVYCAVPHPTKNDTWVWVDPYGVYERADTGCYDLLKDTRFSRLYAPFYPTFHGIPYEVFSFYFGYYPNMGWKLRTLSIHRKDQKLLASGSFQPGIPGGWYVHSYMTPEKFQEKADEYWGKGYIPHETSVAKTLSGAPRYMAIWRKVDAGELVEHRGALTVAGWSDKWQERVVEDGWRVEDYFGYTVNGSERISAFFTSQQPRPFLLHRNRTSAEMDALVDQNAAQGLLPVNFNVAELAQGKRYTGIFRNVPGCWKVFWGRSPSQYQSLVSDQVKKGYKVWKIQGYDNSSRYAVIFQKDGPGQCP
jgi:murein DD-endopeptidase MepM/ murein hydrolase activator NlpD